MIAIIAWVISKVASVVPLILLAFAFAVVIILSGIWPSQARQDLVKHLGTALKEFGSGWSPPVQRPGRRGLKGTSEPAGDQAQE